MAASKKYAKKKENCWKNGLILYKNPLLHKTYYLNDKNIGAVKNKISTEPIVNANIWRLKYIETEPIYDKFLNIVVDKFKITIPNAVLRQIENNYKSNGANMLSMSSNRSFASVHFSNILPVGLSHNNLPSVDANGVIDINYATLQNIVYNFISSDESSIMFICIAKYEHLMQFNCNNVIQSKRNSIDFEKHSRHEALYGFENHNIFKKYKNLPSRIQEESSTCKIRVIKPTGVWKRIHYKFKPKKPLVTFTRHWHIRNTCHGHTLRNILRRLHVNTLTLVKDNYFVIISEARIHTNVNLQLKSLIIAFCKNQESFIDKLFRVSEYRHITICFTSRNSFRNPKEIPKEGSVVIETLQAVMYSRCSTTSSNIINYLQSKNNASKSLKNSLSDLKKSSITNNTEFRYGGFETFAILSINNLLAQHYNRSLNQNKPKDKMYCNSTFFMGKIWLRNFIRNSKYIKAYFNTTLNNTDFINETMFETPLLERYLEVANNVYNILTTQTIFKNILKSLGHNVIYIIFSNR